MATQPLNIDDFAAKIKAKYPDYATMDNAVLAHRIVEKYPEYASQVDLNARSAPAPAQPETPVPILAGYQRAGRILKEAGKDLAGAVGGMADIFTGPPAAAPLKLGMGLTNRYMDAYQGAKDAAQRGDTTESMFKSVAVPFAPLGIDEIYNDAKAGNNDAAIGKGLSRTLQVAAPEIAPKALSGVAATGDALNAARGSLAEKVVAPLVKQPLGATLENARFGRSPAQAITDEGLVGSKQGILEQAQTRTGQLADVVDKTLQTHPNAGAKIDAGPIIDSAIDNAVSSAKKTGNQAVVTRLENLRGALKTEYGPTTGTPFEINQLKRQVGKVGSDIGAFKSTDPLEASAAGAMADVYSGLKDAVNKQVPEVSPLNDRISNLMSAQTALKRNIALGENSGILDAHSLYSAGAKVAKNTIASAPVRTGVARILNAGRALDVPELAGAPPEVQAKFNAVRQAAESQANAVPVDDLSSNASLDQKLKSAFSFDDIKQGGHAGNGVSSIEELDRPGTHYIVSKGGQLTYHGKTFAPESTPAGSTHVTVTPDGGVQVNDGPPLTPLQRMTIKRAIPKAKSARAGDD